MGWPLAQRRRSRLAQHSGSLRQHTHTLAWLRWACILPGRMMSLPNQHCTWDLAAWLPLQERARHICPKAPSVQLDALSPCVHSSEQHTFILRHI